MVWRTPPPPPPLSPSRVGDVEKKKSDARKEPNVSGRGEVDLVVVVTCFVGVTSSVAAETFVARSTFVCIRCST